MQTTFADVEYGNRKKKTHKEIFFEQMNEIMPWTEIYGIIDPYYYTDANKHGGRKKIELVTMTRMYLVSNWFTLSDPATEDEIYDSYAMRTFVGVNFNDNSKQVPDETCLCNFSSSVGRTQVRRKNRSVDCKKA